MTLNASYRPVLAELRAAGVPESTDNAWQFDVESEAFVPFTPAAHAELTGASSLS
jgi:putative long chain acyl-CoA synthase